MEQKKVYWANLQSLWKCKMFKVSVYALYINRYFVETIWICHVTEQVKSVANFLLILTIIISIKFY